MTAPLAVCQPEPLAPGAPMESLRRRVLILAYTCGPERGSEPGVGWNRVVAAAEHFDTWVLCRYEDSEEVRSYLRRTGPVQGLQFEFIPKTVLDRLLEHLPGTSYLAYNLWHRRALGVARRLHREHRFELVHQLNYCGFREPGYLWKLDVPFVWGPVGGTQNHPWRFLFAAGWRGAIKEGARNLINTVQLHSSLRVRRATRTAKLLLAATSTAQRALSEVHGVTPIRFPDTGVREVVNSRPPRASRQGALRILWCGVFTPNKALHLLIEAAGRLGEDATWELRVVGDGSEGQRWQRLARRRGVAERIHWMGWLPHGEALAQYGWADVFVFTSLRDTMGTVVLEALGSGLPVICLDHQGAADVIDGRCGVKIPVTRPKETVAALAEAIEWLARDPSKRMELARGALERAKEYVWAAQGERMAGFYREVMERPDEVTVRLSEGKPPADESLSKDAAPTSPAVESEKRTGQRAFHRGLTAWWGETSRKSVFALVDQGVVSGTRFLTTILIGRICGASELGLYVLAFSLLLFVVTTQDSLILGPFTIYGNRRRGRRKAVYGGSVLVESALLMLAAVGGLAGAAIVMSLFSAHLSLAPVVAVLAAVIPFILLHEFGRRFAYAHLDVRTVLALDVTAAAIHLAGLGVLAWTELLSAPAAFALVGLSALVPGVVWLARRRDGFVVRRRQVPIHLRRNWRLGRWMLAGQLTVLASNASFAWLLALMADAAAAGVFAACSAVVCLSNPLLFGINNILTPRAARAFVEGGRAEVRRVTRKATIVLAGVMGAISVLLLLWGGRIVAMIYGSEYAGNHRTIAVLALAGLVSAAGMAAGRGLLALERSDWNFAAEMAGFVITFTSCLVLIPSWGILGAACGALAARSAVAAIVIVGHEVLTRPAGQKEPRS